MPVRDLEVTLDTGAVLRVVAYLTEVYDEEVGAIVGAVEERPRDWYLDGEPIPEWAGVCLVQMMVATGQGR